MRTLTEWFARDDKGPQMNASETSAQELNAAADPDPIPAQ
jgi:hypothetical protein